MKNIIGTLVVFSVVSALFGLVILYTYNYTIPELFEGASTITYWQAILLKFLSDCLFKDIKFPKKSENQESNEG